MVTMYVTNPGDTGTRFDRKHWVDAHLPLVREAWAPYGLISAAAFFPDGDGGGLIAICPCVFRDEAAMEHALASPATARVVADVRRVTDMRPARSRAMPLRASKKAR